ncbi:ATP-binding protein [Kitasatospora sp. NPDC049285]|uniref:ATP-binding protein n=1 Tax=Kitasatospora sp. NPDC049285 TaxID=3157096 RepID=UPI00342173C5
MRTTTSKPAETADALSWQESFPALRDSVPTLRARVRGELLKWGYSEVVIDDAEVVVAELASNAVIHGSSGPDGDFEVFLAAGAAGLEVAVGDASSKLPARIEAAEDNDHGRGLVLVQALSLEWKSILSPGGGKRIWALIAAESLPGARQSQHAGQGSEVIVC